MSAIISADGVYCSRARASSVLRMLDAQTLFCLGVTRSGDPRHPLYVRGDQGLVAWPAEGKVRENVDPPSVPTQTPTP